MVSIEWRGYGDAFHYFIVLPEAPQAWISAQWIGKPVRFRESTS
jgi:hypothetical protein